MSPKQYLKVSLFLKKIPTISDEQFHEHWKGQHVRIAIENKVFMGKTRKYNQAWHKLKLGDSASNGVTGSYYFRAQGASQGVPDSSDGI